MNDYPKILIINSNSFNDYSGGGITLKNIFCGWPKDKIAVAHWDDSPPMPEMCERYYKIGYKENHYIFPLNLLSNERPKKTEGQYSPERFRVNKSSENSGNIAETQRSNNILKKLFLKLLDKAGLLELLHPQKMSNEFRRWIEEYNPEIIYCQLASSGFINLVQTARKISGSKIVIHIMDDWPSTIYNDKWFGYLLRSIINLKFKKILGIASVNMAISDAMAKEYRNRYKKDFIVFHNPVELTAWKQHAKQIWSASNPFRLMYRGRIGVAAKSSLADLCDAVAELSAEGYSLRLDICTPTITTEIRSFFERSESVFFTSLIPYRDLPATLAQADMLVIPIDFEDDAVRFIRYSMPTKVPEYMASGTPILVYASSVTAVASYARDRDWASVVSEKDKGALKRAIIRLISDRTLRESLGHNAKRCAMENHDAVKVREEFRKQIIKAAWG